MLILFLQIWIWILHRWKSILQCTDEIYETENQFYIFEFQFYSHANGFYSIENEIYHYSDEFYISNLRLTELWKNDSNHPPSSKSGQKIKMNEFQLHQNMLWTLKNVNMKKKTYLSIFLKECKEKL